MDRIIKTEAEESANSAPPSLNTIENQLNESQLIAQQTIDESHNLQKTIKIICDIFADRDEMSVADGLSRLGSLFSKPSLVSNLLFEHFLHTKITEKLIFIIESSKIYAIFGVAECLKILNSHLQPDLVLVLAHRLLPVFVKSFNRVRGREKVEASNYIFELADSIRKSVTFKRLFPIIYIMTLDHYTPAAEFAAGLMKQLSEACVKDGDPVDDVLYAMCLKPIIQEQKEEHAKKMARKEKTLKRKKEKEKSERQSAAPKRTKKRIQKMLEFRELQQGKDKNEEKESGREKAKNGEEELLPPAARKAAEYNLRQQSPLNREKMKKLVKRSGSSRDVDKEDDEWCEPEPPKPRRGRPPHVFKRTGSAAVALSVVKEDELRVKKESSSSSGAASAVLVAASTDESIFSDSADPYVPYPKDGNNIKKKKKRSRDNSYESDDIFKSPDPKRPKLDEEKADEDGSMGDAFADITELNVSAIENLCQAVSISEEAFKDQPSQKEFDEFLPSGSSQIEISSTSSSAPSESKIADLDLLPEAQFMPAQEQVGRSLRDSSDSSSVDLNEDFVASSPPYSPICV